MEVDGKKTIYKKRGLTNDIMQACLISWEKNWGTCLELSKELDAGNVYDTCKNIFQYLVENIKYRTDPDGQQWIRTPARLLRDKQGDCKSYSVLTASVLKCLGIDCAMRFVAYERGEYTHVYVVAFDCGREIKIDAVAHVQIGLNFNEEKKYIKKLDMRTTEISHLSGIGNSDQSATKLAQYFSDNSTIASNYLRALSFTSDRADLYSFLADFADGKGQNDLNLIGFLTADLIFFNYSFTDEIKQQFIETFNQYSSSSQDKQQYVLTNAEAPYMKEFLSWWDTHILANKYVAQPPGGVEVAQTLFDTAPFYLYLVLDNSKLSKKALEKKRIQQIALSTFTGSTWCSGEVALEIIRAGIYNLGYTPAQMLKNLKGNKSNVSSVGYTGELDPDVPLDLSSLSNSQQNGYVDTINNILSWVTTAADGFSKVYVALKKDPNSGKYVPNGPVIPVPSQSDFNKNLLYIGAGLVAVAALFMIFSKKNKSED